MAGGYLSARPLRELRPRGLFASLTSRGLGFPHFSRLTPHKARHAVPLHQTPSFLTPHASLLIMGNHKGCPYGLTPHPSLLTPHSSPLTPHPSLLTPHSSLLTPHSSPLTPHPSPLTPHSSLLTPHPSLLRRRRRSCRAKLLPRPAQLGVGTETCQQSGLCHIAPAVQCALRQGQAYLAQIG